MAGIEPASQGWKPWAVPLCNIRKDRFGWPGGTQVLFLGIALIGDRVVQGVGIEPTLSRLSVALFIRELPLDIGRACLNNLGLIRAARYRCATGQQRLEFQFPFTLSLHNLRHQLTDVKVLRIPIERLEFGGEVAGLTPLMRYGVHPTP